MALDRINGFMNGYNAYNIPAANAKAEQLTPPVTKEAAAPKEDTDKQPKKQMDLSVEVPARENASIENVAISFGNYDNTSIDLFGGNGLASDSMQRAISGMQKDQILHEYQYFVGKDLTGKTSNIVTDTEDGVVIKL